MSARGA